MVSDICQLVIEVRRIHRAGARLNFRVACLDQTHGIAAELAARLGNPHRCNVHGCEVIAHGVIKHRRGDGDVPARVVDDEAIGVLGYGGRRLGQQLEVLAARLAKLMGEVVFLVIRKDRDEHLGSRSVEVAGIGAQNGVEAVTIWGGCRINGLVMQEKRAIDRNYKAAWVLAGGDFADARRKDAADGVFDLIGSRGGGKDRDVNQWGIDKRIVYGMWSRHDSHPRG